VQERKTSNVLFCIGSTMLTFLETTTSMVHSSDHYQKAFII